MTRLSRLPTLLSLTASVSCSSKDQDYDSNFHQISDNSTHFNSEKILGLSGFGGNSIAPNYGTSYSKEANESAINRYFHVPGLNDYYVGQGIAVKGSYVFVSAYYQKTPDEEGGQQPCIIYTLNKDTGKIINQYKIQGCGHAGGLAFLGDDLYVSDTRKLFVLKLKSNGKEFKKATTEISLQGKLKGSFIASHDGIIYLGEWVKETDSYLRKIKKKSLDKKTLSDDDIDGSDIILPRGAQGVDFDSNGMMWVVSSRSTYGCLFKYKKNEKKHESVYYIPRASEDLKVLSSGNIWSLSESGAYTYRNWNSGAYFPFVYRMNKNQLQTSADNNCSDKNPDVVVATASSGSSSSSISTAPPVKYSAGIFRVREGIYYSNGDSAFCHYSSSDHIKDCELDDTPYAQKAELPSGMANHGTCAPCTPKKHKCTIEKKNGNVLWKSTNNIMRYKCEQKCNENKRYSGRKCNWGTLNVKN